MFLNSSYIVFMVPAFILMMIAQWYVNSAFKRWSQVPSQSGLSGTEVAKRLIDHAGLFDVEIEQVQGRLSDHYDPRQKVLRLSPSVAQGQSVAAAAIAAHELGHAVQDNEDYGPLRLRAALVPAVNIGSYLGWILLMIGFFLNLTTVAWLGVFVFGGGAVFALATLPVELNASQRAKEMLGMAGLISSDEESQGVDKVLNAAAMTYVAGLITAVLQLLYYASLVTGMGRRR
jgi:Zn-dependent membrane protease YugP